MISRTVWLCICPPMIRALCILFILGGAACSVLEQTKTQEFRMTWKIDPEDKNQENSLVELSFLDFPGHFIGEYSNQLADHLKKDGNEEVPATFEITRDALGHVSYSVTEIAGLNQWKASFGYGGTSGSPERSPFE
ncbi:MAG: hypothetical protein O3A82_02790 [Verrucomicrobia bacterium]|nr:hypothetical protein [Verrucomicrobiota bacterium]